MRAWVLLLLATHTAALQVGIMYEGWHAPAFWGRSLATNLTVEKVLRTNGTVALAKMSEGMDRALAMNFWFHKEPLDGFYCIYRKRDSENTSSCGLPDCPRISQTLRRHADMLIGAGVDFIVVDSTNIQTAGSAADALQLRPWEVLAEEWLALRRQGVATPKIAIWHNLQDPNGDLWQSYVHGAYSDPAYDELIFKDSQKKVHRRCCSACARACPRPGLSALCVVGWILPVPGSMPVHRCCAADMDGALRPCEASRGQHACIHAYRTLPSGQSGPIVPCRAVPCRSLAQVMFTTADPTAALVAQIESGGEIVVIPMWAGTRLQIKRFPLHRF